ncbi:uncharacterized protein E0L32_007406 [Thyridium curvatum]|uniref:DUF7907 domain-containing protein n=1 Tax=Thyridium curvatum TaxID=1093900 RepID=A0A507B4W9_9PEZI|nr:uncharacterized protein E0L32_007406 [Thyridium curvatum]TPX11908.1 hypothetical protein E0L32_007406 [Thyridium curvatum]
MHSAKSILSLALLHAAALTSASPLSLLAARDTSKGFTLIAKVTDPACELDPPVAGWQLDTAHTGAGLNAAVLSDPGQDGGPRIWYLNGTAPPAQQVLTDGGTPLYPYGLSLQAADSPGEHGAVVNVGQSSPTTVKGGRLVNLEGPDGTFLACKRELEYYHSEFVVLQYAYAGEAIPDKCAAITLAPRCAELEVLPPDAGSSHEFAQEVECSAK